MSLLCSEAELEFHFLKYLLTSYSPSTLHVFVTRTAKNTTSDIVENCLTGIKGKAVCVTLEERKENSYSLSWRVEIPATDLEKALLSDSWATGWAVREYFFRRQRQAPAEWKQPGDGQQPVAAASAQQPSAH